MPKRRRSFGDRNRGAVFVDLDNLRETILAYRQNGAPVITLSRLLDWIEHPDSLGLSVVRHRYIFGTYWQHLRPPGDETFLERRHRGAVKMINFPMPRVQGTPGYKDEVIWEAIERTLNYWDTAIIVSSDRVAFHWAHQIHADWTGRFAQKEAVVIHSHLATSTWKATTAPNAVSIEAIFPDELNQRFSAIRGYNPLPLADRMSA